MELEYRSGLERPTVNNENTVEGYAVLWYNPNDPSTEGDLGLVGERGVTERIQRGAVEYAPEVWAFLNHDQQEVLGRRSAGTLKITEDKRGVRYSIKLPETQAAKDLAAQIRAGNIGGSSFGMYKNSYQLTREGERWIHTIDKLTLYEVSPVFSPVYAGTSAALRGQIEKVQVEENERVQKLESLKKELGLTI